MARDDDSFWLAIFRKNPLVASFLFAGSLIGAGAALYPWFLSEFFLLRMVLFTMLVGAIIGGFIGLIIGVAVDSLISSFRNDEKKNRRRQR